MKVIDLLNKIANEEEVPNFIIDEQEYYLGADGVLKELYGDAAEWALDAEWLNTKVEIIEEPKMIEIPKHIPNEVIQDLDRAICPANVKCIAHKVSELINYLQHTNEGDSNE